VRKLVYLIALAFVAALPGTSLSQDAAALERRVGSLFSDFAKGVSPGATVVVIRDGQVVFRKGHGYADLEHNILSELNHFASPLLDSHAPRAKRGPKLPQG
jgi:CubicO group peptidase (beta-lactamase class C family)